MRLEQRAAWGWGQRKYHGNRGKIMVMGTKVTVIPREWGQQEINFHSSCSVPPTDVWRINWVLLVVLLFCQSSQTVTLYLQGRF